MPVGSGENKILQIDTEILRNELENIYNVRGKSFLSFELQNKIFSFFKKIESNQSTNLGEILEEGDQLVEDLKQSLNTTYQEQKGTNEYNLLEALIDKINASSFLTKGFTLIKFSKIKLDNGNSISECMEYILDGIDIIASVVENYDFLIDKSCSNNIQKNFKEIDEILKYFKDFLQSEDSGEENKENIYLLRQAERLSKYLKMKLDEIESCLIHEYEYVDPDGYKYIKHQDNIFQKILPKLKEQYNGQYVYFANGEVLDSDSDEESLLERVYDKGDSDFVFVKKVV